MGQTVDDSFESGHVQHRVLYGVGDYVETYKTYLQKNAWTHYEIHYLPYLLMVNSIFPFMYSHL